LYHEFGIRGYEYRRVDRSDGTTVFHIEQPRDKQRCPNCGMANVTCQGRLERVFRCLPIGRRPTLVYLAVARVHCARCEVTRQVRVPFADRKRRHTRAFARYAPN
jgi:transposase